ncbi:MAG: YfiT family bacillithiol transferase [Longimicrobiales bacterium]
MEHLRFPIGRFNADRAPTPAKRAEWIHDIEGAPAALREAVEGLDEVQLETPYRPGGWTIRQVVHHVPDSHVNAYVRFRLALTEEQPTIKPYLEARWADLVDARTAPIDSSLALLDALHARWVSLLSALEPEDWTRSFRHPEGGLITLDVALQIYAWHGRHHVAHVTALRRREGWD